ncbi:MAG TPA: hypothetical protein HPP94_06510 [Desulfuromonadales bacterium]|nr:hypothetical protein [Desulfuromonadales bacterium]
MNTEFVRFNNDLASNEELRNELMSTGAQDIASAIEFANTKGYNIASSDIIGEDGQICDELLDGVAGGKGAIFAGKWRVLATW